MVRVAFYNQLSEIGQGETTPRRRQLLRENQPAQDLRHLHIDEIGRVNALGRIQRARSNSPRPGRLQYQLYGGRGIEHDQPESRSSRSTSVGDSLPR